MLPSSTSSSDKFLKLSVPAAGSFHLEDLIKEHFSSQHQLVHLQCIPCQEENPSSPSYPIIEQCKILKHPEYLLIQILRMNFDRGKTVKNSSPILISNAVNILVDTCYYDLIGTISHMGTAEAGHNRAYFKRNNVWYCCEDNHYPFEKQPIDSEQEQNYCLLLKKSAMQIQGSKKCHDVSEQDSNLKRPLSNESISSQETSKNDEMKICHGCGKSFVRLLGHLRQANCKEHYDMEKLREEAQRENNIRKKKNFRERQKGTEYREKETLSRQERRKSEMEKDPVSYREKKTKEQQERREAEIKKDPDTFKEKESSGRQRRRERK